MGLHSSRGARKRERLSAGERSRQCASLLVFSQPLEGVESGYLGGRFDHESERQQGGLQAQLPKSPEDAGFPLSEL